MNAQPIHLVPQSNVEAMVAPFVADFVDLTHAAWQDWRSSGLAHRMEHPRMRANVMWNLMMVHGRDKFYGRDGITVEPMGHYKGFVVGGRIFIRPKYGRRSLKSSNYATRSALAFNDTRVDLFQGMGRLDLVYTLNSLETDINDIALVQRDGGRIGWALSLLQDPSQLALPEILRPRIADGVPAQRIIKPKQPNVHQQQRKDGSGTKA